jgi:hypothetical protein
MDAKKAVISREKACRSRFFPPCKYSENGEGKISAADMEEWVIDACRDEPHKAIEYVLKTDWVAKERYHKNPTEFYKRLARHSAGKASLAVCPPIAGKSP